tara:strand:- start:22566 stop:23234 length:669 start_codon:yes stop_codon:yes gene_type:complete
MVNLTQQFEEVGMREHMDEHGRVKGWLRELQSEDSENEKLAQPGETANPVTPPRPLHTYQQVDEISPTDTSFSRGSLFDTPLREYYQLSSPCAPRRFRDDVSEATSCDDTEEQDWVTKDTRCTGKLHLPSFESPRLQPASLNSYDPVSEAEHDLAQALSTSSTPPPHDPGQPPMFPHYTLVHTLHPQQPLQHLPSSTAPLSGRNSSLRSRQLHFASAPQTQE